MSLKIKYVPVFVKNVKATIDFLITNLEFKNFGPSLIFDNNSCILLKNEETNLMLGVFERHANDNYMNLIILNTVDCLKDYHKLRAMGINFLSTPQYSEMGLAAKFADMANNNYLLIEERDYTDQ